MMTITERSRHKLFQRLDKPWATRRPSILMEHLPPGGWANVATKTDIDLLRTATKTDIDQLRTELHHDIDQLHTATKTDMDRLCVELRTDMAQLRTELHTDMASLELRLERRTNEQMRTVVYANLGSMITLAGILVAAIKL